MKTNKYKILAYVDGELVTEKPVFYYGTLRGAMKTLFRNYYNQRNHSLKFKIKKEHETNDN